MTDINKLNKVMYDKMVHLYEQEKYQLAIEIGKSLLEKSRRLGDAISEKKALEVLSYSSYFMVDYIGAMRYIIQFSKMIEKSDDTEELIKTYFVFISIYTRQGGEYDEAKQLLDKVSRIAKEKNLYLAQIKTENNYGFFL